MREALTLTEIKPYENLIGPEDARLVAGAILTGCSHLVSLDKKHVLRADVRERFLPLKLVSPQELLEELMQAE